MNVLADDMAIAIVFAITGWMLKTLLSHREMKGLSITKDGLATSDEGLARFEQAVEAIAIEIERVRVREGQRYVTKLLDARAQPLLEGVSVPARR